VCNKSSRRNAAVEVAVFCCGSSRRIAAVEGAVITEGLLPQCWRWEGAMVEAAVGVLYEQRWEIVTEMKMVPRY
jgi:hypothetical protein